MKSKNVIAALLLITAFGWNQALAIVLEIGALKGIERTTLSLVAPVTVSTEGAKPVPTEDYPSIEKAQLNHYAVEDRKEIPKVRYLHLVSAGEAKLSLGGRINKRDVDECGWTSSIAKVAPVDPAKIGHGKKVPSEKSKTHKYLLTVKQYGGSHKPGCPVYVRKPDDTVYLQVLMEDGRTLTYKFIGESEPVVTIQ